MKFNSVLVALLAAPLLATTACGQDAADLGTTQSASAGLSATAAKLPIASIRASADDGNVAANAIDGKMTTRWSCNGVGCYIQADLGADKDVEAIDIAWYQGNTRSSKYVVAVSTDGNGRHVFLDPRRGAAMAVCEAARNVSCAGGRPLGVTDCLNFGSPERPEILWQFVEAIEGIAAACRALEVPVVGGNVSFYNETSGQAVLPTPVIGVVGVLDDAARLATQWFKAPGDRVALLGPEAASLGGSEFLWTLHGRLAGELAPLDLELERRVQAAVRAAVAAGLVTAAHDCAEGGLAVALAECAMSAPEGGPRVGCSVALTVARRADETLFGEGPSRVVVSVEAARAREFEALMAESAIPWRWIGVTGGDRLVVRAAAQTLVDLPLEGMESALRTGFERHLA